MLTLSATMGAAASITAIEAEGFKTAFDRIDLDGNGVIDREEFALACAEVVLEAWVILSSTFVLSSYNTTPLCCRSQLAGRH